VGPCAARWQVGVHQAATCIARRPLLWCVLTWQGCHLLTQVQWDHGATSYVQTAACTCAVLGTSRATMFGLLGYMPQALFNAVCGTATSTHTECSLQAGVAASEDHGVLETVPGVLMYRRSSGKQARSSSMPCTQGVRCHKQCCKHQWCWWQALSKNRCTKCPGQVPTLYECGVCTSSRLRSTSRWPSSVQR
jgi:hypothetical protein